jgi:hypothetical protein
MDTIVLLKVLLALESACIVLFLVMFLGSLITETGKELLFHGFIAGLVGVGLATFDIVTRYFLEDPAHASPWLIILAVFGIFVAIFLAVVCLNSLLEWRSVPLESVGKIDGDYIDAIYDDNGDLTGASVINITSSRKTGFLIRGTSYDAITHKEKGKFDGIGSVSGEDGLCYSYVGHEHLTTDHGVCYYRFSRNAKNITFFGGFIAFGLRSSHRVQGRKVQKGEQQEFDKDNGKTILQAFLTTQEKNIAPSNPIAAAKQTASA